MKIKKSNFIELVSMYVIKISRKYFLNTWVYRLPITTWIYRKIFYLGRVEGEQEILFRGKKLLVRTKDISIVPALINQYFEEFELELYEKILQPGMTVLDIGANIGIYSIIASEKIGDTGAVYAFEPVPENLRLLKHNLELNNTSNVHIVNCAIGDKQGEVEISLVKDDLATHYIGARPSNSISVKVDTVDSFVSTHRLKVGFVKMDIEGYEGHALDGAKRTFSNTDIMLLTEFSADYIRRAGKSPEYVAREMLNIFKYCYSIDERKKLISRISGVETLLNRDNNNFLLANRPYSLK